MKLLKNHAFQEAALMLIGSGWLVWYSLDGYNRGFDKNWGQSPYLFTIVVAVLLAILGMVLLFQIAGQLKKGEQAEKAEKAENVKKTDSGLLRILAVLGLCLLYYIVLATVKMPYLASPAIAGITLVFSTFELATIVFLAALLLFMGVRKPVIIAVLPITATLLISILFRSMLHVLLP